MQDSVERKTPNSVTTRMASLIKSPLAALSTQAPEKPGAKFCGPGLLFITITYSFPTSLDFLIKKVKHAS